MKTQVVFAYANPVHDLDGLKYEARTAELLFFPYRELEIIGLTSIFNTSPAVLAETLHRPSLNNKFSIFHFAGHSKKKWLVLEGEKGGVAQLELEGFTKYLKEQKGLKLVFFNSCHSAEGARACAAAGIPAAIGANGLLDDYASSRFVAIIYSAMLGGDPIEQAFKKAVGFAEAQQLFAPDPVPYELFLSDSNPAHRDFVLPSLHDAVHDLKENSSAQVTYQARTIITDSTFHNSTF